MLVRVAPFFFGQAATLLEQNRGLLRRDNHPDPIGQYAPAVVEFGGRVVGFGVLLVGQGEGPATAPGRFTATVLQPATLVRGRCRGSVSCRARTASGYAHRGLTTGATAETVQHLLHPGGDKEQHRGHKDDVGEGAVAVLGVHTAGVQEVE